MPSDMDQFELGLFSSLENTNIVCDQVKDDEQLTVASRLTVRLCVSAVILHQTLQFASAKESKSTRSMFLPMPNWRWNMDNASK